ncbi:MAG: SDR family NAD(P)-dependent oxidoreductase [Deltaproteobacteria bacterium]|nr:SDR family NAD(P)-dependent oxidoreductase [Deltaproteobacteria bacterium]
MAIETILVTGANAGLGKEAARQLAAIPTVKKVYLGCRNQEKAHAAKVELEAATGRTIFEILALDTTKLDTVSAAIEELPGPIDGVILNAGGMGGPAAADLTHDGVIGCFAVNVLGHAALVEGLIASDKLRGTVVYVGSEASRGIPGGGVKRPDLATSSADEFASIANGAMFTTFHPLSVYGLVKYVGTMWTSSMSRRHPTIRFVTVSPGATSGTDGARDLGALRRFFYNRVAMPMMSLLGRAHGVERGAQRYIVVLTDDTYETGRFYASPWPNTSGELVDQSTIFEDLDNERFQDHAYEAVHRFLPSG